MNKTLFLSILMTLLTFQLNDVHAAKVKNTKSPAKTSKAAAVEATPTPAIEASPSPSASPEPSATPTATPAAEVTPTPVPAEKVAEATQTPAAVEPAKSEDTSDLYGKKNRNFGNFVVGPYITLLSIPRPANVGIEVKYWDLLGVSGEYGMLPQITFDEAKLKITGTNFRFKIYPFRGGFYLGVGMGSQTITVSTVQTISTISTTITGTQKNNFIMPQLGWNWVWDSGFFMGMDLGVQLSSSRTTTITTDQTNALVTGSAEYQTEVNKLTDLADKFGKIPFPLLTLLKFGYFF